MKKTKLIAGKLRPAPLDFQTSTIFKFTEGETYAYHTTHPTTATIRTLTRTRIESAEMIPLVLQNTTFGI